MPVQLASLAIVERDDGPWFEFAWKSDDRDAWFIALEELKATIPPEARQYDPTEKVWRVAGAFEPDLERIFPGFAGWLDGIRSQMILPMEGKA